MARGAPDYQERVFASGTLATEDDIVIDYLIGPSPGGNAYGSMGPVPAGHYWKINHIAAWNTTSPIPRIEALIMAAGVPHMISTMDHPSQFDLYWWDGVIWLDEGWTLEVGFIGTILGDNLEAYCNGIDVIRR